MRVNIRAREIELTDPIKAYTEKKMLSLLKFYPNITMVDVELAKNGKHHRKGDVFTAKINVSVPGKVYRVEEAEKILYKAIDKAKDDIKRALRRYKGKKEVKNHVKKSQVMDGLKEEE
jgi:putative sigma-54 modulation protein